MTHMKTQAEWEEEMSFKILQFIRNELYLDLRFLNPALSALIPKADASLQTLATNGIYLYYSTDQILRIFQKNPKFLTRAYLHSVLHCVFSHLWIRGNRERSLWNLACDIVVEYTIDVMEKPSTKRILTWLRSQIYEDLAKEPSYISAASVYRMLLTLSAQKRVSLQTEFYTDDHHYWPASGTRTPLQEQAQEQWGQIARQTKLQQERQSGDTNEGSKLFASQIRAERSRRNYGDFLRKFSIYREELHTDPDAFDLNFYTFGLRLYGNLPLIEALETREVKKIREFVIVVDTSDSTSGKLVKNFLRETFRILHEREHFFTSCNIRILQCDDQIRSEQEIQNLDQFERFLEQFTIIGGGGTDFRPAFAYVNSLIEQRRFLNLSGLLYFTDGQGIYPQKRPQYQTAFLFLGNYEESAVPPWAMRLQLEPEEFL